LDDRKEMYTTACAIWTQLAPKVNEVLRDSLRVLGKLDEKHPMRFLAHALMDFRMTYLDHAVASDLPNLIGSCNLICSELERRELGLGSEVELGDAVTKLGLCIVAAEQAVHRALKEGKLAVRDGKIVAPTESPPQAAEPEGTSQIGEG
jgi:hypothetical protein